MRAISGIHTLLAGMRSSRIPSNSISESHLSLISYHENSACNKMSNSCVFWSCTKIEKNSNCSVTTKSQEEKLCCNVVLEKSNFRCLYYFCYHNSFCVNKFFSPSHLTTITITVKVCDICISCSFCAIYTTNLIIIKVCHEVKKIQTSAHYMINRLYD